MLRLLLITTILLLTNGLKLESIIPKSPPILCRDSEPIDAFKLNSEEILKSAPLTESAAIMAFAAPDIISPGGPVIQRKERAAIIDSEVSTANTALGLATGNIISKPITSKRGCPSFSKNGGPQPLCPHTTELLRTFYNQGFCYVLFPNWQKITYTRCLCRTCRTGCKTPVNGRRNYCRPELYSKASVWAICRSGWTWKIRKVSVKIAKGGCECMSYINNCYRG